MLESRPPALYTLVSSLGPWIWRGFWTLSLTMETSLVCWAGPESCCYLGNFTNSSHFLGRVQVWMVNYMVPLYISNKEIQAKPRLAQYFPGIPSSSNFNILSLSSLLKCLSFQSFLFSLSSDKAQTHSKAVLSHTLPPFHILRIFSLHFHICRVQVEAAA